MRNVLSVILQKMLVEIVKVDMWYHYHLKTHLKIYVIQKHLHYVNLLTLKIILMKSKKKEKFIESMKEYINLEHMSLV